MLDIYTINYFLFSFFIFNIYLGPWLCKNSFHITPHETGKRTEKEQKKKKRQKSVQQGKIHIGPLQIISPVNALKSGRFKKDRRRVLLPYLVGEKNIVYFLPDRFQTFLWERFVMQYCNLKTLKFGFNPETKEMVLQGMGNSQLEILVKKAQSRFSASLELRKPRIAYKETVKSSTQLQGKYKKQSGGRGQYGDVWLKIEPRERGSGFEFLNKIVGGRIPGNYIPAVEKGVKSGMEDGVIAGYPVIDLRVSLYDGSYHEVDSSNLSFEIAGRMALKKGIEQSSPWILEPIMNIEVRIPDEYTGATMGDLNSRRGRVLGMEPKGKQQIVKALIPQTELFTYSQDLRSMTKGQGEFIRFSHYEEAPAHVCQNLMAEFKKKREEEE